MRDTRVSGTGSSTFGLTARRFGGGAIAALAFAAALGSAEPVAAQEPPPAAPPLREPAAPSPRLEPIDYDARKSPRTAGDVLIWIPRVIFFPVYLVAEYVIRLPLQALTVFIEQHRVVDTIKGIFVFGPNDNIGVVPTGLIDFGFRPSIGVYFFYDDFISKGNGLRVHLATGGVDWLRGTVTDRIPVDEDAYVKLRFEGSSRPDYVFFGTGPRSLERDRSRYGATSFEESVGFYAEPREGNGFEVYGAVKDVRFDADVESDDDPSLARTLAAGRLPTPDGFAGYTALRQGLRLGLDSRKPRPLPGTGLRFEANVEHDFDMRDAGASRWLRWGATAGGFVDLTGHNRVVSLSVATQFSDPLGEANVPFTELATLGGEAPMHGFLAGRLLDRSAIAATLEYRWPIWAFLDGSAQLSCGNVFGEHFTDFDPELLRLAFTLGVRSNASRDHSFNVMVGGGTETFEAGAELNSFRFVFGATRGF